MSEAKRIVHGKAHGPNICASCQHDVAHHMAMDNGNDIGPAQLCVFITGVNQMGDNQRCGCAAFTVRWYRFIPLASDHTSQGWGVFDRKLGRFLTDAEVASTPLDALRSETYEEPQ